MKKVLVAILFLFSTAALAQDYMLLPIVKVHDGDTIKTDLTWRLPAPLNTMSIRIGGIDTPEMPAASYATTGKLSRAKCDKEALLALKAKERVKEIVGTNTRMKVTEFKWGKYGGRMIAKVSVGGVEIEKTLLSEGIAVENHGTGVKQEWCQ